MGAIVALTALAGAQASISISQAKAQSEAILAAGEQAKAVADVNTGFARLQEEDALQRGEQEATRFQGEVRQLIGAQRARLAAQGLDLERGSALEVQLSTAQLGAQDVITIRNNAFRESLGFRVEAISATAAGRFAELRARTRARNTLLTGGLRAVQSGVSFASQLRAIGSP